MTFHELTLKNFFSFEEATVPLHKQGLVTIVGKNLDSSVCGSNGAGKSALIVDAWCWVLFGRTPRGQSGKSVVRRGAVGCAVTLSFYDGQQYWHVTRYQNDPDQKNNIVLLRSDGEEWIDETLHDKRDTQKKLDSIIGIPMDVALSAVILGQNSIAFATMTDGDKKGVLETVLQFDTLNNASMKAKARCGKLRSELNLVTGKHGGLFELRESSQVKKFDTEKEQHSWKVRLEEQKAHASEQLESLSQQLLQFRVECFKLKHDLKTALDSEKQIKDDYDTAVKIQGEARVKVVDLEATLRTLLNQFIAPVRTDLEGEQNEVRRKHYLRRDQLQGQIKEYEERILKLSNGLEATSCPTCNQPLPQSSLVISHLEEELNQDKVRLASAKESLGEAGKEINTDLEAIQTKYNFEKDAHSKEIAKYDRSVSATKEALATARNEATKLLDELMPLQSQIQKIRQDQTDLQQQLDAYNRQISSAESTQKGLEDLIQSDPEDPYQRSIDLLSAEINALTDSLEDLVLKRESLSYQLELYDFWVSGFGKKGIQSFMLDSVIPFLNEKVAEYSKTIWEGETHIEFATQKLAADGKTLREDFHVIIDNNSGANEYLGNSAGERERIDLVIALAVQDLVISRQGVDFNMCVFDEACRFLDPEGAEGYHRVLRQLAQKRDSIFVISHSQELQSLFGNSWVVSKENKISTLSLNS